MTKRRRTLSPIRGWLAGSVATAALMATAVVYNSYVGAQSIDASGISAQDNDATIVGFGTSQGASPLDRTSPTNNYAPHANPVGVYVKRPGFKADGSATHVIDFVTFMSLKRQQDPNESLWEAVNTTPNPDERTAMLSEAIYSIDTVFDASGNEDGITNNSTLSYHPPVGTWCHGDYLYTGDGNLTVDLYVTDHFARKGTPVACVEFVADDGTTTQTVRVSTLTSVTFDDGVVAPVYRGVFDSLDNLDAGLIKIKFIIKPHAGTAYDSEVNGNGQREQANFTLTVMNDHDGAYGRVHAMVDPASTEASAQVYTTEALMTLAHSGNINTAYASIVAAKNAIAAYNNANFTRPNWHAHATRAYVASTDCGGGVIHLQAGTYANPNMGKNVTTDVPLTIQKAAAAAKSAVIYDMTTSRSDACVYKTRIQDLTLRDNTGSFIIFDSAATAANLAEDRYIEFNGVVCDLNGAGALYGAMLYRWHRTVTVNVTGDELGLHKLFSSVPGGVGHSVGCENTLDSGVVSAVACRHTRGSNDAGNAFAPTNWDAANYTGTQGPRHIGHSFITKHTGTGGNCVRVGHSSDGSINNFHIVGCVFESALTSGSAAVLYFSADSDVGTNDDCFDCFGSLVMGNTFVGERLNVFYNDDPIAVCSKSVRFKYNYCESYNSKDDTFGSNSQAGAFDGIAWPQYKVGFEYNVIAATNASSDRGPGIGNNWNGEVEALGEFNSEQNSNVNIDPDWTLDRSGTGGLGDGDYRPGASTELIKIPTNKGVFSVDLNGAALNDDGQDYVGALQAA